MIKAETSTYQVLLKLCAFLIVGMISQDVSIKPGVIKVVLKSDAKALDEVVVTAMGISREKKRTGLRRPGRKIRSTDASCQL